MANYIKYSTNAQTRALKMGNFWLGPTNDGKGPTSSTGYYTALNPPSGGFTIYANKTSNGPAIFQASNESQLVSITNQIGGTSFTTSGQCLNWYITQTDKFILNKEYEGIITNGLIFCNDYGTLISYSRSGSTTYDLSSSRVAASIVASPTFSTEKNGDFNFDGGGSTIYNAQTTKRVGFGSTTQFSSLNDSNFTIDVWVRQTNNSSVYGIGVFFEYGYDNAAYNPYIGFGRADSSNLLFELNAGGQGFLINPQVSDASLIGDGWVNLTAVCIKQGGIYNGYVYKNGVLLPSLYYYTNGGNYSSAQTPPLTVGASSYNFTQTTRNMILGAYFDANNNGLPWPGRVSNIKIYNRALTTVEMQQNYNAMKSRFI